MLRKCELAASDFMIYAIMIPIPADEQAANIIMLGHIHQPAAALTALIGKLAFHDIPACILRIPH